MPALRPNLQLRSGWYVLPLASLPVLLLCMPIIVSGDPLAETIQAVPDDVFWSDAFGRPGTDDIVYAAAE